MGKYWKIQLWDSTKVIFERNIKFEEITKNGIKEILKSLTSKHALTEDEIIRCYLKSGAKLRSTILDVHKLCGEKFTFSCDEGVYALATLLNK